VSEWFHADGDRQVGPLTVEAMGARFRAQQIDLDTLVWRDGLPGWQPLRTVADELGLAIAAPVAPPPPPVPTSAEPAGQVVPDPSAGSVPAPAHTPEPEPFPGAAASPAPPAGAVSPGPAMPPLPAPRQGLSKGMIAAIVIGGSLALLVPVGVMLAAIAIPAYQEYTARAQLARAVTALQPLQAQVLEFANSQGRCPTNADPGFPDSGDYRAEGLSQVQLGRFNTGNCGIETTLSIGQPELEGDLLWLEYETDTRTWTCSGQSDDAKLPAHCRG